jgi:hypothetical protein
MAENEDVTILCLERTSNSGSKAFNSHRPGTLDAENILIVLGESRFSGYPALE